MEDEVDPAILAVVRRGKRAIEEWRRRNSGRRIILTGADLRGADLRGANLRAADLRGADLRGADLRDAKLHGADLAGTKLVGADLRGTKISKYQRSLLQQLAGVVDVSHLLGLPRSFGKLTVGSIGPSRIQEFRIGIDPGDADANDVAELLTALSDLFRAHGGLGLEFAQENGQLKVMEAGQ